LVEERWGTAVASYRLVFVVLIEAIEETAAELPRGRFGWEAEEGRRFSY
jgi:hypothetical protein